MVIDDLRLRAKQLGTIAKTEAKQLGLYLTDVEVWPIDVREHEGRLYVFYAAWWGLKERWIECRMEEKGEVPHVENVDMADS